MHIGGIEAEVSELRRMIQGKVDKHEIYTINSRLDSLEHSVREISSSLNGLSSSIGNAENRLQDLEFKSASEE